MYSPYASEICKLRISNGSEYNTRSSDWCQHPSFLTCVSSMKRINQHSPVYIRQHQRAMFHPGNSFARNWYPPPSGDTVVASTDGGMFTRRLSWYFVRRSPKILLELGRGHAENYFSPSVVSSCRMSLESVYFDNQREASAEKRCDIIYNAVRKSGVCIWKFNGG